ncbi:hypothetical protein NIES4072_58220 [Nostoc commune NIES-4072]|uniref:Uncharacterized protein n=1 Tax=Nostoc commune NIES-4072 TaxID=2005467 RepID=A0A2R5FTN2_NOSCO|nr:hypothetical protein NIES4070_32710 [Nostoc commune HK-02]GBG22116.1 hypothetical protein NIES4072_58220 [Nostoc commune NIES-4072]
MGHRAWGMGHGALVLSVAEVLGTGVEKRLIHEYQRLIHEYQRLIHEYQRLIHEYQRLIPMPNAQCPMPNAHNYNNDNCSLGGVNPKCLYAAFVAILPR